MRSQVQSQEVSVTYSVSKETSLDGKELQITAWASDKELKNDQENQADSNRSESVSGM